MATGDDVQETLRDAIVFDKMMGKKNGKLLSLKMFRTNKYRQFVGRQNLQSVLIKHFILIIFIRLI